MRALVLVGLLVAPARADVTLEQPAGVCSLDAVRDELARLPAVAHEGHVRVESSLHGDHVAAVVTISDQVRAIRARDCGELAKSIALIVVMALRDAPSPAPTSAKFEAAPAPAAAPAANVVAVEKSRPRARTHAALLVGGAGDLHGRTALVAGARAGRGRWSLGLELRAEPSETLALEDGGEVRMSRAYVTAAPCVHLGGFAVCGIATGGALRGRGIELADATAVTRPIVELGSRVEWSYRVAGPLALRVHLDATQALTEARFMVDQMPVWTSESRELRLGAGVVANYP